MNESTAIVPDSETERFLEAVFGAKDEATGWIELWRRSDKRATFSRCATDAVGALNDFGRDDVYASFALLGRVPANGRGKAADSIGIVALAADIDLDDPDVDPHGKTRPSEAAALDFIQKLPLRPSVLVASGHGLQAWWTLSEPWIFADAADLEKAENLARGWQGYLSERAREAGFDLDSTFDFARVMRIAGTRNLKVPDHPKPVRLLSCDGPRYEPGDFADYVVAPASSAPPTNGNGVHPVGAEEVTVLLENLLALDSRFAATWNHERPDLRDQSPSGYEQALASIGAARGLTDAQIAAVLVEHRRKWDPAKLDKLTDRTDYVERTIRKAREGGSSPNGSPAAEVPLEPGTSLCKIAKVEEGPSKSSGKPRLHLKLKVLRGEHEDEAAHDYLSLQPGEPLARLKALVLACGLDASEDFDTKTLQGRTVVCRLEPREFNGKVTLRVVDGSYAPAPAGATTSAGRQKRTGAQPSTWSEAPIVLCRSAGGTRPCS